VFSDHDMVEAGVGEALVSGLLGDGRLIPPSSLETMWNSSVECPIMARNGDGGPLGVDPMALAFEPSLLGENLRPPKSSMMNSRLQKRMVSPMWKPPHDWHSPSAATMSADDGTIRSARGKHATNPPSWCANCQCFLHQ
jgi:hypothetical protein